MGIMYLCKTCRHFESEHNSLGCTIHEYSMFCPCNKFIPDKPSDKEKERYLQTHRWDLCKCKHSLNVHDQGGYCTGYADSDLRHPKRCECMKFQKTDIEPLVDTSYWYKAEQDLNPVNHNKIFNEIQQTKFKDTYTYSTYFGILTPEQFKEIRRIAEGFTKLPDRFIEDIPLKPIPQDCFSFDDPRLWEAIT